jgi:hypothetical protein
MAIWVAIKPFTITDGVAIHGLGLFLFFFVSVSFRWITRDGIAKKIPSKVSANFLLEEIFDFAFLPAEQ